MIDNLANATNYYNLNPFFKKAFDFTNRFYINNVATTTTEIDRNLLMGSSVAGEYISSSPPHTYAHLIEDRDMKRIIIKVAVI